MNSLLEKLVNQCANGGPHSQCTTMLEENHLPNPHSVSLVSVATMLAGLLPLPACHSDEMYLIIEDQASKDMDNITESCGLLQPVMQSNSAFQELLVHLTLLHQVLVSSS